MDSAEGPATEKISGVNIEILRRGKGRPVLFLHPHIGLHGSQRFIELLARDARVIAPSHPGFGHSELPKGMTSVDDMSYFYLDLIEELDLPLGSSECPNPGCERRSEEHTSELQ